LEGSLPPKPTRSIKSNEEVEKLIKRNRNFKKTRTELEHSLRDKDAIIHDKNVIIHNKDVIILYKVLLKNRIQTSVQEKNNFLLVINEK